MFDLSLFCSSVFCPFAWGMVWFRLHLAAVRFGQLRLLFSCGS